MTLTGYELSRFLDVLPKRCRHDPSWLCQEGQEFLLLIFDSGRYLLTKKISSCVSLFQIRKLFSSLVETILKVFFSDRSQFDP